MANEVALNGPHDSVSATDGAALNLLNDNVFDLILLDINMPGMNGVEVCQKHVAFASRHGHFCTA
jgi:CheY-like chemotaxis protein